MGEASSHLSMCGYREQTSVVETGQRNLSNADQGGQLVCASAHGCRDDHRHFIADRYLHVPSTLDGACGQFTGHGNVPQRWGRLQHPLHQQVSDSRHLACVVASPSARCVGSSPLSPTADPQRLRNHTNASSFPSTLHGQSNLWPATGSLSFFFFLSYSCVFFSFT